MPDKRAIRLTMRQRDALRAIITTGQRSARVILRARILLRSADGWTDEAIARALDTSVDTVRRTRRRGLDRGILVSLSDAPRTGAPHKLTEEEEARIVALACSHPPTGQGRWTVRLLTTEAIERQLIRPVVPETVRQVLQKTTSSPGRSRAGATLTSRPSSWRV